MRLTNQLHVSFPIWQLNYAEDKVSVIHEEKHRIANHLLSCNSTSVNRGKNADTQTT